MTSRACRLFVFALAVSWASPLSAQGVSNLGFEERGTVSPDAPRGWNIGVRSYRLSLDSTQAYAGRTSLRSERVGENPEAFGVASQTLPVELVRGRRIQLSGWIRTDLVTDGYAGLWMRVDGPLGEQGRQRILAFDNLSGRGATGTTPWTRYEITLPVDSGAVAVAFGVLHPGNGSAWFDNLELRADGKLLDASAPAWAPSARELAWLRRRALPLATVEPGSGFEDEASLRGITTGARIIGLGEGTHGTREFFLMKHRLIEWLAEREGVTVFAIEANMPEARLVNEYVLTGRGDPRQALAGLYFWTWNTEEVLDLIEWMRQLNASGRGRIEFWGFDAQVADVAVDSVLAFVGRRDPALLQEADSVYDLVQEVASAAQNTRPEREIGIRAQRAAERLLARLEGSRLRYLAMGADSAEVDWALQYARVAVQAVKARLGGPAARDRGMAANVSWILRRQPPGTRMVLWAHNGHVQRARGWMGAYLGEEYGDEYRAVGFAFGEGEYSALGPRGLAAYAASAPPPGTIEHALGLVGLPRFALDLRGARSEVDAQWLLEPLPFRSIGALARDDPFSATPIGIRYDGLIYIARSTATRRLPAIPPPDGVTDNGP